MANQCIPSNPDISGIGVRTAIYAQNFLCFAPVVAHLWDGKVTFDEIKGIKDQSIGMLAVAFAILISAVIEAKGSGQGQSITSFHAAVVLDLSWMNNTSTFIWFLLYAHHRSINEDKSLVIPATWSGWLKLLFSPIRRLGTGDVETSPEQAETSNDQTDGDQSGEESGDSRGNRSRDTNQAVMPQRLSKTFLQFIQRLWDLILQAPVLTLGSIHLSLMSSIGIWLWSDLSRFGTRISCDPTLTIMGGAVPFSSQALRICSLLMYSILLIPGFNLVPGFLFFISLHILYNKSRRQHPQFWTRYQYALYNLQRAPSALRNAPRTLGRILNSVVQRRHISPSDEEHQIGDNHPPIPFSPQPPHSPSGTPSSPQAINPHRSVQDGNDHQPIPSQLQSNHNSENLSSASQLPSQNDNHVSFLVVDLVFLFFINGIFLSDIELTLSRNKRIQSREEGRWGFGQVLALLLLVIPLRDFATSINDIREKIREKKEREEEMKREAQRQFEDSLRSAIQNDTLENYGFRDLIERGASSNTQLNGQYPLRRNEACPYQFITGAEFVTLLQFAAYKGNKELVEYLLKAGADLAIKGECRCAPQPSMTLTPGQEGGMGRRFRQLQRMGTLM